ncbi:hypothetical protein Csa_003178, partial [Cucumis sativus]
AILIIGFEETQVRVAYLQPYLARTSHMHKMIVRIVYVKSVRKEVRLANGSPSDKGKWKKENRVRIACSPRRVVNMQAFEFQRQSKLNHSTKSKGKTHLFRRQC